MKFNSKCILGQWLLLTFISSIGVLETASGQLTLEGSVYHEATNAGLTTNNDQGGALFLFFRNNSSTTQTFANGTVSLNGQSPSSNPDYDWSRTWPISIEPGEVATLTFKGDGGDFAPGQLVDVTLTSDTGSILTQSNISLSTPKLRVGNVVPSQDLTKSYVYLRNDDTSPYTINSLHLNDDVTSLSRFIGGSTTIAPNSVKIVEVDLGQPQDLLTPYAVRVEATRTADSQAVTTGAPVRLTEPIMPTASWHHEEFREEVQMEKARQLYGQQIHGATSRFPRLQDSRTEKYSIRGLNIDILDFAQSGGSYDINTVEYRDFSTGVPGGVPHQAPVFQLPQIVSDQANNPSIYGWYIRDEPDLQTNSIHRNPQAMWRLNETYWLNSAKPTFLNMVSDRSIQRYGLIADHPAIDRYMQFAPLSDNNSGVRNIDQSFKYAESLKNNVEPLRMWWITQGVAEGVWGNQPTDWGIDVQFWSAIMAGAKGIVGFMYQDNSSTFPNQHNRQVDLMHELQIVRGLTLYGEPLANTTIRVGGVIVDQQATNIDAAARSIVGEHAVLLPVANMTGTQTFFGGATFTPLHNVTVDVSIPDWISVDQVRRVTADGFMNDVPFSLNGQQITITIPTLNDTDVFVIGETDTTSPMPVTNLRVATRDPTDPFYVEPPDNRTFLSWDEPFDNFGVHGFQLFEDNMLVAEVPTPAAEIITFDPFKGYKVRAYDASGNFGGFSNVLGPVEAVWNGNDSSAGTPGDGISWGDPLNWTVEGVVDTAFSPGNSVTFSTGSSNSVVNLQENRTVGALDFEASYTLTGGVLTVEFGHISVDAGAVAELDLTMKIGNGTSFKKIGEGTLRYSNGLPAAIQVADGVYAGAGTNVGIEVLAGATLRPDIPGAVLLSNNFTTMRTDSILEISIAADGKTPLFASFGDLTIELGAILKIQVDGFQPYLGYSNQIAAVLGSGDFIGEFDTILPSIDSNLAWHVSQDAVARSIVISIISSADFDEDGTVDHLDLISWQLNYNTAQGATPAMGDADRDGDVDGHDFLMLQRQFGLTSSLSAVPVEVPEPAEALLLVFSIPYVLFRKHIFCL